MCLSLKIFISHSSKDLQIVDQLIAYFRSVKCNKSIFCSSRSGEGVNGGEKLNERIFKEFKKCRVIVYLISSNFLKSTYCQQELVIGKILNKKSIYILTPDVNLDDLNGFVNSKIDKMYYINKDADLKSVASDMLNKPINSSDADNAVRTFLSATEHTFETMSKQINEKHEYTERLKKEREYYKVQYEKQSRDANISRDIERMHAIEDIFASLMYDLGPEEILQPLDKCMYIDIVEEYEKLSKKNGYSSRLMLAFISSVYLAFGYEEKGYLYFLKSKEGDCVIYKYMVSDLLKYYHGDTSDLQKLIESKIHSSKSLNDQEELRSALTILKSSPKLLEQCVQ